MRIFLDCEFTGLHKDTTLISIGMISEDNRIFYAELQDYDKYQVTTWIRDNVLKNLLNEESCMMYDDNNKPTTAIGKSKEIYICKTSRKFLSSVLPIWLKSFNEPLEFWGDCPAYDWVLFCDLFGGALNLPNCVYYIPFDISTLLKLKELDPDINREKFVGMSSNKHNALDDAIIIRAAYNKLMEDSNG